MKSVRYTKYGGDLASEMSMDDLLEALSDYLLDSGFRILWPSFRNSTRRWRTCRRPRQAL